MDVHKHSAFERLEIVETGRRRRWSEDEKLRIVMESQSAPRLVSATARRHGISRSQLGTWLRSFRTEQPATKPEPAFVPVLMAPGAMSDPFAAADDTAIVVDLPGGSRLRIAASTPPALAAAVLRALR
ncbi:MULTISPECIES: IS66-like element accessory protein TnpA [Xanthobacteraceae]|jgi:transposase|uniref:Transposase n=2 Tax=Xanthobacteraceae TaxID=335928 RepID=A0A974SKP3_9HYPH|nr:MULTISPECIES: transposase [Xanthobacteraceae]QRG05977.1 transposase [Xanthobacter dioxanivorans]QRG06775.1 transposase [Xanthobacter dioxanivorans]QRG06886.1 transposase [Xanthobacter dioxanivorans]QRG07273.1 transposase [Xanthobacter dioxanivorans]QRG08707.1 transposase [Xanthobacter dioxanivorans]